MFQILCIIIVCMYIYKSATCPVVDAFFLSFFCRPLQTLYLGHCLMYFNNSLSQVPLPPQIHFKWIWPQFDLDLMAKTDISQNLQLLLHALVDLTQTWTKALPGQWLQKLSDGFHLKVDPGSQGSNETKNYEKYSKNHCL